MVDELIRRILQLIYSIRHPSIRFNRRSNVDTRNCLFEGFNYVGDRTVLRDCDMGYGSYIADQSTIFSTSIGRYCSISSGVKIVCGRHPTDTFVSTHPSFFSPNNPSGLSYVSETMFKEIEYADEQRKKLVKIGNDVWIGFGAIIFDGVDIADGTIVAAGAVVTKSTQPYSIIGGVPAKLIRKRFDEETIDFLMDIKWWDKDPEWIYKNAGCFSDIKRLLEYGRS